MGGGEGVEEGRAMSVLGGGEHTVVKGWLAALLVDSASEGIIAKTGLGDLHFATYATRRVRFALCSR